MPSAAVSVQRRVDHRAGAAVDIGARLGWYQHGRRDPTTWRGPTWLVRAMRTPDGPATGRIDWSGDVTVTTWGPGAEHAATSLRAMTAVDHCPPRLPDVHPQIAAAARQVRGLCAGASGDLYHALVPTILQQRITAREGLAQWRRLAIALGESAPGPFPGLLLPPDPADLARRPVWWFHHLGIEGRRARTLIEVAKVARHLWAWATDPAVAAHKLTLLRGVGPWTMAMVLGPACGDDDAVVTGDLHFPNIVAWNLAGEPRGSDERMLELLEPYRPYRGLALRLVLATGRRPPAFGPKHRIVPIHRF